MTPEEEAEAQEELAQEAALWPELDQEPDFGGVLGADGQVHSDADPGL